MYEDYETQALDNHQAPRFLAWFDKTIGTEREVNEVDLNTVTISCYELTPGEVQKCRKFENSLNEEK